jgi:diguanylate cyclase (GGDEF)-like protein
VAELMSKFLNRESEGWQCARDDIFNRMVNNLQANKQKVRQDKSARSSYEEENLSADKLQEYENIATRDPLTGVYNTRYIAHKLVKEVQRGKRYKRPFSLMLISLANFLQLKKVYGDLAVDDIVKACADLVRACIRDVDILGRFSEDQFAIILPETDSSRALIVSNRIRERIAGLPISQESNTSNLSLNIGLVSFPTHARDENSLLTTALEYLEQARQLGHNQVYTS